MKLFSLLLFFSLSLFAISNHDLAVRCDKELSGFVDASASMRMFLINAQGQKRERLMKLIVLEKEGGDKSLMEFLSPADVKGTKFLNYEHIDKDDDQWLYLPALKRVKRIASKNKSGSFMGSEFAYEDLSNFSAEKYQYEGDAKEVEIEGKKFYQGQSKPISKNSGYTKQVYLIDPETFLLNKMEYYDKKNELLKTAIYSGYKKIDNVWRIGKIEMLNHQNDKQTILIWEDETIKNGLKDNDFHKRVLKK